jgi:hypothetical protein
MEPIRLRVLDHFCGFPSLDQPFFGSLDLFVERPDMGMRRLKVVEPSFDPWSLLIAPCSADCSP